MLALLILNLSIPRIELEFVSHLTKNQRIGMPIAGENLAVVCSKILRQQSGNTAKFRVDVELVQLTLRF